MKKKVTILVVDDEPNIRSALEYNLKHDGFTVYLAENGLDGLRMARKKKPDLILLDWMMPEMDGIQVIDELKKHTETKKIPVFMLTAKGTISDVEQGYDVGADVYITKPFDMWKLADYITEKLEKISRN